jgi:tetratricopeptide (TPR) repeat protein
MADERPPAESQRGRGWLRGVLARFAGRRERGDVIAANVEGGARGVAVGKNIVQIGTLNVPVWPLLGLLLAIVVAAGVWALSLRGPATMGGQFNVAVADFVELDGEGRPRASERADQLGALVFDTLAASYPQPGPALLLWRNGSVPYTRQGARIAPVADADQAVAAASAIKADVLIYGALDSGARFTLQLYVSPRPGIYGDANAIVGAYRFGDPIQLDPTDMAASSDALTARARALVALVHGLRADSKGDFGAARASYEEAEKLLPAGRSTAKAIILFFKGQSAYYASVLDPQAQPAPQLLNDAGNAFAEALRNDATYARAQIGLAGVLYERAWWQKDDERLQQPELEQAIGAYKQAIALAPRTSQPEWVAAVATQGLATAYYLKGGTLFMLRDYAAADAVLSEAATLLTRQRPALEASREPRLLAQSQQALGNVLLVQSTIAQRRGDAPARRRLLSEADAAYADCIAQGAAAAGDAAVSVMVSGCAEQQQQVQSMLNSV